MNLTLNARDAMRGPGPGDGRHRPGRARRGLRADHTAGSKFPPASTSTSPSPTPASAWRRRFRPGSSSPSSRPSRSARAPDSACPPCTASSSRATGSSGATASRGAGPPSRSTCRAPARRSTPRGTSGAGGRAARGHRDHPGRGGRGRGPGARLPRAPGARLHGARGPARAGGAGSRRSRARGDRPGHLGRGHAAAQRPRAGLPAGGAPAGAAHPVYVGVYGGRRDPAGAARAGRPLPTEAVHARGTGAQGPGDARRPRRPPRRATAV